MYSNKAILFSFGIGGHNAQANRLAKILLDDLYDFDIVTISDLKTKPEWSERHYICSELRGKYSHFQLFTNNGPINIIKTLRRIKKENNIKFIISTGPGISVVASVFLKLYGVKIIHIESWSRFSTKSLTGRFMYYLADKFYVQNKTLQKIYPKAIYSGVL